MTVAVVFAGGDRVPSSALADLPRDALVVGADSGIDHALALGWRVDVAVGDFDSVSADGLAAAEAAGAVVERHRPDKDATDLELALARAVDAGATRIVVVAGAGGRFDHVVANALVLLADDWAGAAVEARFGGARAHVVRDALALTGGPGDVVTLLAVTRPVEGVTTTGLRYPLAGETLHPGSSRGVSNELDAPEARIEVARGPLLVVRPGAA